MSLRFTSRLLALLLLLSGLFLNACKRDVNRFQNRAYHNTTAHFNGYFNGREVVRETKRNLLLNHQEDYTLPLPLFIYPDEGTSKSLYPDMDEVLKKCYKVINRHSMEIKGEEHCKWIDDTWLLIGQAHFYKRDFKKSEEAFKYVARKFRDGGLKDEALIWEARTYIEREQYSKADRILSKMARLDEVDEDLKGDFHAVYADYHMKNGDYDRAIDELKISIEHTKKRKVQTRRMFILAQLNQSEGNLSEATRLYAVVEKRNPPYEMAFYSKINRALSTDVGGDIEAVRAVLNKMLRDDKNIEFRDQIYYAMAELELKENDREEAIEFLKLSAKSSVSNDNVKGLAFLRLADLYFEDPNYAQAQVYYDSTVTFLSREHPDFDAILGKSNSLSRLVRDITIVEREDSLQQLIAMDKKVIEQMILERIDKVIEAEEEAKREEQQRKIAAQNQLNNRNSIERNNFGPGSKAWYFENPGALARGFSEFRQSWGERKLEDNWRRSDKRSSEPSALEDLENQLAGDSGATDLKDPETYWNQLPNTPEKLKLSHNLIIEALYDLALVYREEMNDNPMAINSFEDLIGRYDTCKYALNTYYQLYLMHEQEGNSSKSNYYKNLILNQHANSEYAMVIKNPNYLEEKRNQSSAVQDLYKKTLAYYNKGYYMVTIEHCDKADQLYPQNDLKPKFDFLRAMSKGGEEGEPVLLAELGTVVQEHRGDEVSTEAQRIIEWITTGKDAEAKRSEMAEEEAEAERKREEEEALAALEGKYKYDPLAKHVCVLLFPSSLASSTKVKASVSDFNKRFFARSRLRTTSILFNRDHQLVSVKVFDDKAKAMDYHQAFRENKDMLSEVNGEGFTLFVISYTNYATFYRERNVDEYMAFFNAKYFGTDPEEAPDDK